MQPTTWQPNHTLKACVSSYPLLLQMYGIHAAKAQHRAVTFHISLVTDPMKQQGKWIFTYGMTSSPDVLPCNWKTWWRGQRVQSRSRVRLGGGILGHLPPYRQLRRLPSDVPVTTAASDTQGGALLIYTAPFFRETDIKIFKHFIMLWKLSTTLNSRWQKLQLAFV